MRILQKIKHYLPIFVCDQKYRTNYEDLLISCERNIDYRGKEPVL
jgi:hypothetical protein